jgi:hypothetical protein
VPDPANADAVAAVLAVPGDEGLAASRGHPRGGPDLQRRPAEHLVQISRTAGRAQCDRRAHGFVVYDAHVNVIEGNHMQPDYRHLAWKKRPDPKGLPNLGKSLLWKKVRHDSTDEIEALGPPGSSA